MNALIDHFTREMEEFGNRKRDFLEIGRRAGRFPSAVAKTGGRDHDISVWCSNDYLSMGQHPVVLAAVKEAVDAFGAGAGGSRNIGGTNHYHVLLEKELAELHGKEAAAIFPSGYTANDGALSVLAGRAPDTIVFSDELNHASIIDGLRHSKAEKKIFRHNDTAHLEELIAAHPDRPKLIVLESVYSMSGDVAPLAEVVRIAKDHDAVLYLDEVHAVGMYGPEGAGIAAREGLAGDVDVVMGTTGKGFGTAGGYIAGPAVLVDAVRSFSRSFIFTTSLPPSTAAGALAAVKHLRGSELERTRLAQNARLLQRRLTGLGIPFISADSHIVSVFVGDDARCRRLSALLLERHGIYVQPINAPSVRTGEEILRAAPSATHTTDEVERFAAALDGLWSEVGMARETAVRAA
ncbi:5-aminolevulinate synthase [Amycolatopsis vastitatis]|uniref:8-amino-7-oxononanoate synthase n=1 Tax=Amycolatopsis vastitatis TaxID=1905142 RepID=A0A229SKZ3_9PSEU|nr:5-aminolevulinate synthase [Amycolatopsis vastitatis]OXM59602.1 5-aminolevulinate synthase [Amycolatopsis vastitatis]